MYCYTLCDLILMLYLYIFHLLSKYWEIYPVQYVYSDQFRIDFRSRRFQMQILYFRMSLNTIFNMINLFPLNLFTITSHLGTEFSGGAVEREIECTNSCIAFFYHVIKLTQSVTYFFHFNGNIKLSFIPRHKKNNFKTTSYLYLRVLQVRKLP